MNEAISHYEKRRKYPRHHLHSPIQVIDGMTQQRLGTLANLSLDGLMIMGRRPLKHDRLYQLTLHLPQMIDGKSVIQVGVDCLWSKTVQQEGIYWSGCHIIDYADNDMTTLVHMIEKFGD